MFALRTLRKLPKNGSFVQSLRRLARAHGDSTYERLQDSDEGISVFGFNRPKERNALGANLIKELQDVLQKICVDDSARVLVIRSLVRGIFCAGADLKERSSTPPEDVSKAVSTLRSLMEQIHNVPIPVIAAVDGAALGGGLELSLACDIRIASTDAKMGLVEPRLAIIPGAGGTQRLPRLINPSVAKELIYTARVIDGDTAYRLGVVNHLAEQNPEGDAAYVKALEIAREILPNGPVAVQMAKKAINKGMQVDLGSGMAIEEACYARVIPTRDRVEGLKAFQEKRKPNYVGQ